jgi:hypothetical protein
MLMIIKDFGKSDAPISRHGNENVEMLELEREKMELTICSTRTTTRHVPMHDNRQIAVYYSHNASTRASTCRGVGTGRDQHGYGFTRTFVATGPTVTGTVPDFDTHAQTVPVAAVSQYTSG